LKHIVYLC